MRWVLGRIEVELIDEPTYSFGSADNVRTYSREVVLTPDVYSTHGLTCSVNGALRGSVLLGSSAPGPPCERSCILRHDRCIVAVGNRIAGFCIPSLELLWQAKGDEGYCFGLLATPDDQHVVVHGELALSKFTMDGTLVWECEGNDVFAGACEIRDGQVHVTDFNDWRYVIDLVSGQLVRLLK